MKIENFYNHLLVQDGLQKITVEGYRKVLNKFFRENKHFNRKSVESYIADMRQRECRVKGFYGRFRENRVIEISKIRML